MRALVVAAVLAVPLPAGAWTIGSQLDYTGCHEKITAEALRNVRTMVATAPPIAPTRDEAALIDDVQFVPPSDFVHDLAAMTLLLGVRDNDLKGNNPLDSLNLVEVHGNPDTQDEHCIRAATDDEEAGNVTALAACRDFIIQRATEALDGLGDNGAVDPSRRMALGVWVSFAGHVDPQLPLFYVRMGQAMHALEDSFTHTYRTADGMQVTYVLNWIDNVTGTASDESRDGPPHLAGLDHCESSDPLVARNYQLAVEAATALLAAALEPAPESASERESKVAAFQAVTAKYLGYAPGCTIENNYCDAPERDVANPMGCGCRTSGDGGCWLLGLGVGALVLRRRRTPAATRRRGAPTSGSGTRPATRGRHAVLAMFGLGLIAAQPAHADTPRPAAGAHTPTPTAGKPPTRATGKPTRTANNAPQATDDTLPQAAADVPAVPVIPQKPGDVVDEEHGKEPGRDVATPTVQDVATVREKKRLGSPLGVTSMMGGSLIHGAANVAVGGRYRINERWLVGADLEWNPWFTSAPLSMKTGVGSAYATLVRRFPMKFDPVNLRSSLHLGASTLLFDVNGAPKYSVGPFASFTPLGIDYDLGHATRLVIDPVEIAVPIPHVGLIPLYYEQFRLMVGIQIGA